MQWNHSQDRLKVKRENTDHMLMMRAPDKSKGPLALSASAWGGEWTADEETHLPLTDLLLSLSFSPRMEEGLVTH